MLSPACGLCPTALACAKHWSTNRRLSQSHFAFCIPPLKLLFNNSPIFQRSCGFAARLYRISDPPIDCAHVDVALRRAKRSPEAYSSDKVFFAGFAALHELPSTVEAIASLEETSYELFLAELKRDEIREILVPTAFTRSELCNSSTADESVLESDKQKRFAAQD